MRGVAERVMHRADQRRAERQHADAVARGAFGEQHHRVAAEQPLGDFLAGRAGLMPGLPVDEDGPLQFRQPAEDRPARDLAFGDEHHGRKRRDHEDVQPRDMVRQDQRGARSRSLPDLANPHADQRAENAMIPMRNGPLQRQAEGDADQLQRQQRSVRAAKASAMAMTRIIRTVRCARTGAAIAPRGHAQRDRWYHKKRRPRPDAATDGDRWGRMIRDGGP